MSAINTGSLDKFIEQCKCSPEETNLLVLYLTAIRLHQQFKTLQNFMDTRFMVDGEGI